VVERKEYRWIILFSLVVILLTTLPYALGYFLQTESMRFSGLVFNLEDSNSYLAKMLRGGAGDWLFRTPYTTFPQKGVISFLPYLLLGKLSALPGQHDQLVFYFHCFRWLGIFLVVFSIYRFFARFLSQTNFRKWGTFLSIFGGGLGWLVVLGLSGLWKDGLPLEFYSPETFGFLSFLGIPHLLFSRAFLILGFDAFLFIQPSFKHRREFFLFVVPWFLLGFFQPMSLITAWMILGLFIIVIFVLQRFTKKVDTQTAKMYWSKVIWIAVITAPFILYNFIIFRTDPILKSWLSQNILTSPPVVEYLLAFLIILPFAIAGLIKIYQSNTLHFVFFGCWMFLFPVLAYFPLPIQRRLPEGIWIALVLVAIIAISYFSKRMIRFSLGALSIGCLTSLIILVGASQSVLKPSSPRYLSLNEMKAIEFLQAPEYKNVHLLASFPESNILPAWTPVFVLTGHGPESVHQNEIYPQILNFFQGKLSIEEEISFLRKYQVEEIFFGPEEKKLGNWDPAIKSYLEPIFANDDYAIYRVKAE
jgi:hypothetical protein